MTLHSLPVNLMRLKARLDLMKVWPDPSTYWYQTVGDIIDIEDNLYCALVAVHYTLRALLWEW